MPMTDTTTTAIEALPIETAPKDGTMLRLLVDYTSEGANPLEDKRQAWTIGFNQLDDTEEDVWEFAGWSWEQDCFTAGYGVAIGWLPFHAARDLGELAALRDEVARLLDALGKLHHAVCGETGFAQAVRDHSKTAYHWPALDDSDEIARAALTSKKGG